MSFRRPAIDFGQVILSHDARPATTKGASITPAQNAFGSYTSVIAGASVTRDAYGIWIDINNIAVASNATDALLNIALDPAGGTSWGATPFIPNLLVSAASSLGNAFGGGISYFFPLFIKAGTSIGAAGSINRGTVGTMRVSVRLLCDPSDPLGIVCGSTVTSFGENTAASCGTAVTAGTTSEGSWTQLGSAIAGNPLWFWNIAMAPINDAAMNNQQCDIDMAVGDASNKKCFINGQRMMSSTNEDCYAFYAGHRGIGAVGDLVYARGQVGSSTTAMSAIAYGVGG